MYSYVYISYLKRIINVKYALIIFVINVTSNGIFYTILVKKKKDKKSIRTDSTRLAPVLCSKSCSITSTYIFFV